MIPPLLKAPKIVAGLATLLLLGAGCTNGPPHVPGPEDAVYEHIGDASPTIPEAPVITSCNHEYYPLRLGYHIQYHISNPIVPGLPGESYYSQRVTKVTSDSATIMTSIDTGAGTAIPTTSEIRYNCVNGGIYPTGYVNTGDLMRGGAEKNLANITTDASEGTLLPQRVRAGDLWSNTFTITITPVAERDADELRTHPVTRTIQTSRHAIGMETIHVPAGTFEAMRINVITTFKDDVPIIAAQGTEWWVKDVGMVKSTYSGGSDTQNIITVATGVTVPPL